MFRVCSTVSTNIVTCEVADESDPTKYQTEEDRTIIRNLIQNYVTDKRTIILSVFWVLNLGNI
jgi:hypothetical protein